MPSTQDFYAEWKALQDQAKPLRDRYLEAQAECDKAFARAAKGSGTGPSIEQLDKAEELRKQLGAVVESANAVLRRFCSS